MGWERGESGKGEGEYLLQGRRAKRIEPEPFPRVHDGQLARHGQHGAFAGRVGQLRRCAAEERDHAGGVDDAAALFAVLPEGKHGVFGAEPDAFDVYRVREVPDFFCLEGKREEVVSCWRLVKRGGGGSLDEMRWFTHPLYQQRQHRRHA